MEPLLVLTLQLVVEPHALDLQSALLEPGSFPFIRTVDLGVMFELALALEPGVEGLPTVPFGVAIGFQQVPAAVRQDRRLFAVTRDANGLE
jgi:hypothetical protein